MIIKKVLPTTDKRQKIYLPKVMVDPAPIKYLATFSGQLDMRENVHNTKQIILQTQIISA
ncbi:MAG TPA: hypothetical protein DHV62_06375 [Elusimicrobia bacterium]|nr:hypothetical protein [Elusimicrobiota bacterium]